MTDPEQGGELAAIVATMQAEYEDLNWALDQMEGAEESTVRNYWATGPVDGKAKAMAWQVRLHWPTIRAALERQAELAAALREYGNHTLRCPVMDWEFDRLEGGRPECTCDWAKTWPALLAEPAAEARSGRG